MTNIDGHSLVDCGGLWWLGAISSVLPMCHVHVAVFALGCEATYISVIPKIPKKMGILYYPNHCLMTIFNSIWLVNLPRQISKVFVHLEALWRNYLFYISKWHEIYTVPSYAQIINLLQIVVQSNHLCEPRFNLYFMAKLARCKASVI